jgi:uncharacterized protein DUF551
VSRWRKIKTAPKDGTKILLYEPECTPFIGWWDNAAMFRGWSVDETSIVFEPCVTHWMPLPEPPK